MKKPPTAAQFLKDRGLDEGDMETVTQAAAKKMLINFAKLHVEAALAAANKNAKMDVRCFLGGKAHQSVKMETETNLITIDKNSILNALPN